METTNLLLRPWLDSDGDLLLSYILNPLVGTAAGWLPPGADDDSKQILKRILTRTDTFTIALKTENYPLGSIALMPFGKSKLAKSPREGEIGFWLGQEFWGQGYMSEAIAAMLAAKRRAPEGSGSLQGETPTFALTLIGIVIILTLLQFMPVLVLGPVAEHLTLLQQLAQPAH